MTKSNFIAILAAAAITLAANVGFAQITGTAHDLSGAAWNTTTEICVVCHTPHNADTTIGILWNHELTTHTGYTLYDSATLNHVPGDPGGSSKLCLSCHDGTVAVDSFGGATGTTFITGNALLGTDLSGSHPLSFLYDSALATADGELSDPLVASSGLGSTIDADMLFAGMLECGSCHDPHNNTNNPFLVMSNASSTLCLTCHTK